MRVRKIIENYLRDNGFDGLKGDECGCAIGDLFLCEYISLDCVPGYKTYCDCDEDDCGISGYHISASKPEAPKAD